MSASGQDDLVRPSSRWSLDVTLGHFVLENAEALYERHWSRDLEKKQ